VFPNGCAHRSSNFMIFNLHCDELASSSFIMPNCFPIPLNNIFIFVIPINRAEKPSSFSIENHFHKVANCFSMKGHFRFCSMRFHYYKLNTVVSRRGEYMARKQREATRENKN
jgi:hypothetical protein